MLKPRRHKHPGFLFQAIRTVCICAVLFSGVLQADPGNRGRDISPAEAANIAKSRHGGKVLKINEQRDSYRVKLLLDSGTIKNVPVDKQNRSKR